MGVVLGFQGANVGLRYSELLYEAGATPSPRAMEVGRGITAEFLGGLAGIVLGILAPLRICANDADVGNRDHLRGNAPVFCLAAAGLVQIRLGHWPWIGKMSALWY